MATLIWFIVWLVLTNCAIMLGCELEDLIEPAWREWKRFG